MKEHLDIGRCFNDALEIYKQHWTMLVVLQVILGLLIVGTLGIVAGPLVASYNLVLIELLRKKKDNIEIADLFVFFNRFWPLAGLFYLQLLIVAGGFMLFIIPGVIFSVMLLYVFYFAADKGASPKEAIKKSWNIVLAKGFWPNFIIGILAGAIMTAVQMIPLLGSILGLFAAPFTALLIASAYIQQVDLGQEQLEELNLQNG
ncbi:MAG: hypothetical protein K9L87_01825 [Candidatus Omnitrophica bacterium]|nr:hypothetical protein [Candidatus Omnitrophota bacterium]MCF7891999.1 hypothetical protein [Candidatus Omnitrophota bacterium]MCF7897475.1 hypothetical protein [Candidatus Omnitrophota bacterium]MCF7909256.1 hypothetical protein [Candidatus Omnitrophota bacterium]